MFSNDYTKEVNVSSGERLIPLPLAIVLLVALAVGGWFGVGALRAATNAEKPAEKTSAVLRADAHTLASR